MYRNFNVYGLIMANFIILCIFKSSIFSPGKTEIFDFNFFRGSSKIYANRRFANFRDRQSAI